MCYVQQPTFQFQTIQFVWVFLGMLKFLSSITVNLKFLPALNRNCSHLTRISKTFVFKNSLELRNKSSLSREVMNLSSIIKRIEEILPPKLAESWDNTGLLIEPETSLKVSTVFLTNDLTEGVLNEAIEANANLIISYHPPIFSGMKSLVCRNWKDRIVMKCIANNIAVYSPHTACDAVQSGVNDWLIKCFDLTFVKPIKPTAEKVKYAIECIKPATLDLKQVLGPGVQCSASTISCDEASVWVKFLAETDNIALVIEKLKEVPSLRSIIMSEYKNPIVTSPIGMGRIGKLTKPLKLSACIEMMKKHAKVSNIRVSIGAHKTLDTDISVIAACAGSGGSILKDVPADLYVTGEMSHHDILDCHQKGICVILCEHSNSERGYLSDLANQLSSELLDVGIIVSSVDKDPISIL